MKFANARRTLARLGALALIALAPTLAAFGAQDQEGGSEPDERPPIFGPEVDDATKELQRLFQEVERNLKRIDEMLYEAGAGDLPLGGVDDSGLDELLRQTRAESESVVQGIDKILEVARQRSEQQQQQQQSGSGQGGQRPQSKPGGTSPLDQQRDQGPRQNEATPEGTKPEGEQEGEEPKDGDEPDSPEGDDRSGENRPGRDPRRDQGEPGVRGDDAETWGMLPDKVQSIFRNEGTEDLPVQYRDWIDAYYRRLNETGR